MVTIRGLTLLSTKEAAQRLKISRRRIQQLCQSSKLGIKVGSHYLVAAEEIQKYLGQPVIEVIELPDVTSEFKVNFWDDAERLADIISDIRSQIILPSDLETKAYDALQKHFELMRNMNEKVEGEDDGRNI